MIRDPLALKCLVLFGYSAVGAVLILVAVSWQRRNAYNLICKPVIPFLATMALVHSAMPIAEILTHTFRYQAKYSIDAHVGSWVATILGAFSVVLGVLIAEAGIAKRVGMSQQREAPQHDRIAFLLFVVLPSLFACYKLYSLVSLVGYEEFLTDRIGYRAHSQEWAVLSNMVVAVPAFYTASYFANRTHRRRALVLAVGSFILSAFLILATGNRNSVFLALICVLLVCVFYNPRSRLPAGRTIRIVALTCIGGFLLAIYGQYRRAAVNDASPGLQFAQRSMVRSVAGAFGNHELMLWQLDRRSKLFLGETYLAGFAVFVPRVVWPGKPLGAGPRIKNEIEPGSYVVGREGDSSLTTGFLVESWMNFRLAGPVLVGLVWGVVLAVVGAVSRRTGSPFGRTIAAYLVLTCSVSFVYSEFLGWMGRTVPIVIGLLAARFLGRSLLRFRFLTLARQGGAGTRRQTDGLAAHSPLAYHAWSSPTADD